MIFHFCQHGKYFSELLNVFKSCCRLHQFRVFFEYNYDAVISLQKGYNIFFSIDIIFYVFLHHGLISLPFLYTSNKFHVLICILFTQRFFYSLSENYTEFMTAFIYGGVNRLFAYLENMNGNVIIFIRITTFFYSCMPENIERIHQ